MNHLRFLLIYVCLITRCVSSNVATTNSSRREDLAKKVLADKENTPAAFALAIDELSNDNVPASFWLALANDTEYPNDVRSAFIVQLFRKYVHPGMTLKELAVVVGPAKWVNSENVFKILNFSGTYPVRFESGDTGYAIFVLPDGSVPRAVVYMAFGNSVEQDDLLEALNGITSKLSSHIVIKDIGIFPGMK